MYLKSFFFFLFSVVFLTSTEANKLPFLYKNNNNVTQLIVDGKPFLMVAGELHNSSASQSEYLKVVLEQIKNSGINTVLLPISWEDYEPTEGVYNNALVDNVIKLAKEANLKIGLLWFGSWKNGVSSYTPLWVKSGKQFLKLKDSNGVSSEVVSVFCDKSLAADKRAFVNMIKHIKLTDTEKTIVIVQVQNEVGAFQDIDYNKKSLDLFSKNVPENLIKYLNENKHRLTPEMFNAWKSNGFKSKGNWSQVFGTNLKDDKNFFMSWHYANYINEMCKAAKLIYPIPMFVNAWIVQHPGELPGSYPNGGPVSRVLDVYKAVGTHIDFSAPDIYKRNFKEIIKTYHRYDNPLFIPECTFEPGRAFYAYGQHDAICYAPFGYDNVEKYPHYSAAIKVLNEMSDLILQFQGTGKMKAFLREENKLNDTIIIDNIKLIVDYRSWNESIGFGIVIRTTENEFVISGVDANIRIVANSPTERYRIASVQEGGYVNNKWRVIRNLNGDETDHNKYVLLYGRNKIVSNSSVVADLPPQPDPNNPTFKTQQESHVNIPGIYKVVVYKMN